MTAFMAFLIVAAILAVVSGFLLGLAAGYGAAWKREREHLEAARLLHLRGEELVKEQAAMIEREYKTVHRLHAEAEEWVVRVKGE